MKPPNLECPFQKRKCIGDRCVGWQEGPLEKEINGEKTTVIHGDCFVVWDLLIKKAIAKRTDGTQVAIESFRNEMVRSNAQTLATLLSQGPTLIPIPPPFDSTDQRGRQT